MNMKTILTLLTTLPDHVVDPSGIGSSGRYVPCGDAPCMATTAVRIGLTPGNKSFFPRML
jgi:hypothetical protein